jgi:hypothetical protein
MPYAFNDDRSKFDLDTKFVILQKNVTIPASSQGSVKFSESELTSLGIDHIANYALVSLDWRWSSSGWRHDANINEVSGYNYAFPYATWTNTNDFIGVLNIQMYNFNTTSTTFTLRAVMMKIA